MVRIILVIIKLFNLKPFLISLIVSLSVISIYYINNQSKNKKEDTKKEIRLLMEYAYIEGQKDVLEGDIRVKKINDSTYVKTKSLWD